MNDYILSNLINRYIKVHFIAERKISTLIADQIGEILTLEQHLAISYLADQKLCTVSELAEALMVKPSAITAQMNRLVSKGLVNRIRDEQDRRVVYLSLTEAGRSILEESKVKTHQLLKRVLSQLTEEELEQFLQIYEKLEQIVSELPTT